MTDKEEKTLQKENVAQEAIKKTRPKREKKYWNVRPYLAIGLVVFVVAFLIIAVVFGFLRYEGVADANAKFWKVLQPILIGLVLAYLVNPIVRREESYLLKKLLPKSKNPEKTKKLARSLSIAGALTIFLAIIAFLIGLIIPQVVKSVQGLVVTMPGQVEGLVDWFNSLGDGNTQVAKLLERFTVWITNYFQDWLKNTLLPQSQELIASITSGVINVVKSLINAIIGVIISIYILTDKEKLKAQTKKLIYTVLKPKAGNWTIKVLRKSDTIFGGFIIGKIIDSIIIGIIAFVVLAIMKMPYTVLIAVIVGVTNIIPFFGPFIGAIPSALLILLVSPLQALYFLIFVVILQQVDGNIIGPKILGDKTGLSTFWVLFAILVFGGLFGIPGMILGVPVFGVIYYIVQEIMGAVLKHRKLPVKREAYEKMDHVDLKETKLVYPAEETKDERKK